MKRITALALALLLAFPAAARAQEGGEAEENTEPYALLDGAGETVTYYMGTPDVGDEYISGENRHFRVTQVDAAGKTARVEDLGQYGMPDVSWLDAEATLPVSASGRKIAIYCTHSDESYEPTDGASSLKGQGGIYDVAGQLAKALGDKGVEIFYDDATHHPHDAGAYRRSRATAVTLLKNAPDALFDVHRDGIPDPDEYAFSLAGRAASKVRLLVGRSNQNNAANKAFAAQVKAVGDRLYPGLIKDIYIGKGSYNQDLSPRALLLEFGTHTISKERVLASVEPIATVLYRTLYGGVTGAAGASDANYSGGETQAEAQGGSGGAWTGVAWVLALLIVGALVYGFVSSGSATGAGEKFKRTFQEMTGGLFGGKKKDGQ